MLERVHVRLPVAARVVGAGAGEVFGLEAKAARAVGGEQAGGKLLLDVGERDPVLRALRPGEARLDGREVEVERGEELRVGRLVGAEESLRLRVALDELDGRLVAARAAEVAKRLLVHRKEAHRGAVLGGHVGNRRAVRHGERREARPEELDEAPHHAKLAQHLGDGEHEVGGGGAFGKRAGEAEAHHLRHEHVDGLPEHDRLRLNTADAPAGHAEAVDHRRVRVRADERVRVGHDAVVLGARPHRLRHVLQVDLVADARGGRDDVKVVERLLAPAEELVALLVARELELLVELRRIGGAEVVHHHRVVDDEVDRHARVDAVRVAAEAVHRRAHRRKVHHGRDARKVLKQHARGHERDLFRRRGGRVVGGELAHVLLGDEVAVALAQERFEEHLDRERHRTDALEPLLDERVEAVEVGVPGAGIEGGAGAEGVAEASGGRGLHGKG